MPRQPATAKAPTSDRSSLSTAMAWAHHVETSAAVHISMFTREETGKQCGCECLGCKAPLEAVNAGRDPSHYDLPRTQRPFFRHARGQQRDECLVAAARLAALRLLAEQDVLELPAPRRDGHTAGLSGSLYIATARGAPFLATVARREWIDSQTARIVLDDGRVVLLMLTAHIVPGSDIDGLIVISVNDPEVAAWSPDEILAAAKLDDAWSCWAKHWDDDALQAEAGSLARAAALEACDLVADGAEFPYGLSKLQQSESVLHWAVKELLAELRQIGVEGFSEKVTVTTHMGAELVDYATVPDVKLFLSEVKIEHRLGELVPDITCRAHDPTGEVPDLELLIEVAVTNPVSRVKLQRILDRGVACIELDVRQLGLHGPVTRTALRELLRVSYPAVWLNAPFVAGVAWEVQQRLERQSHELQLEQEEREEEERHFGALSADEAAREYLEELQREWSRTANTLQTTPAASSDLRRLGLAIKALARHGLNDAQDHILTSNRGLIWQIQTAGRADELQSRTLRVMVEGLFEGPPERKQFISILLTAIRAYGPSLAPDDYEAIQVVRAEVLESLMAGERTFARPKTYDALLSLAFPTLARELAKPVGTAAHADKVRVELQRAKWTAQREAEEERRQANAIALAAREAADRTRELAKAYKRVDQRRWAPTNQVPLVVEFCLRRVGAGFYGGIDTHSFIRKAWAAREGGVALRQFLEACAPTDKDQLGSMLELLGGAWLLESANKA